MTENEMIINFWNLSTNREKIKSLILSKVTPREAQNMVISREITAREAGELARFYLLQKGFRFYKVYGWLTKEKADKIGLGWIGDGQKITNEGINWNVDETNIESQQCSTVRMWKQGTFQDKPNYDKNVIRASDLLDNYFFEEFNRKDKGIRLCKDRVMEENLDKNDPFFK